MITVFTPTYNRAYILSKLYESLLKQTDTKFEWVIVDDGSIDDTETLVAGFIKNDNPFQIVYIKQENGGKHRAINRGVEIARGNAFFIVDSDDSLTEDAIEKIYVWLKSVEGLPLCAGVAGLKGYSESTVIGGAGKSDSTYIDARNNERRKYGLLGDKSEVYFTEILRKYPFPEFDGEKFITEETVWNAIALDGYFIRWYKDIIYLCDYLDDGLTKSGETMFINNPQGTLYWARQQLVAESSLKMRYKAIYKYYLAAVDKKSVKEIANDLGITKAMLRFVVTLIKIKRSLIK